MALLRKETCKLRHPMHLRHSLLHAATLRKRKRHNTWHFREACHMCAMTLSYVCHDSPCVCHDSFICVTWFIHTCDMAHLHVCRDSFTCVPWLIHKCDMIHSYVWHGSVTCVPCLIHVCAMTHSYVCHDLVRFSERRKIRTLWSEGFASFLSVPSLILCVCHDSFLRVPWLNLMSAMTHSYVRHDSFIGVCHPLLRWTKFRALIARDCVSFICVVWLIHMCAMTHSYV